ncbi:hypothetical protein RYZ26_18510 [Terasakiella sp. A23]|uniref:hypothetical protein n=1 Tax=Terasakiella sp. FCG-A23 TaxID=3080561 RepID=UPI002954B6F2|nr:hypothetical protein [Terasakiella sp. A23]MDV7341603.1 hypothetical protein [Terasakiella sp. A23]
MLRFAAFSAAVLFSVAAQAKDVPVIELTQTPCQFVESENGTDHGYKSTKAEDCNTINAKTKADRLASAEPLTLAPGKYIFRVKNENVPYELGFWIRDHDYNWKNPIHKITKTSVSGGGLTTGVSKDYEVELKPGTYHYSCPLNPTPDYTLIVK